MQNSKPRILLVDDDPMNLFLLEELLGDEGYTLLTAASGTEALAVAKESIPDLILLDVMMPEMDGFEVCQRLRQDPKLQTVSVIFLTALDDDQSRLRGLDMMGDDYLTKPINSQLLLAKITNILRLSKMRSQQSRQQVIAAWEVNDYISEKFRLFVPEQYLDRIAPEGVESIRLGNAREEEITVVFCDIRGFTAIAESQSAMETFKWLNAFFTQMSQAIASHHGFVDKFLGDALLAIFDRPEYHAADAINAALTMQDYLKEFNRDLDQYKLESPINIGIGIHTGLGLIGTVGSDQRMDSTVIGDVVNTAARLEELTKIYKCPILASHTTLTHVKTRVNNVESETQEFQSFESRWVDRVTPRGKQQALDLYEILAIPMQKVDIATLLS
ncbi:MAG TPA: adenylate/guanylate cyclase domain-containing response regulator [Cyanobacteria bacterium UBA12227]|nr:adenylate/guanylate cyclase domain-containing response regulator [Cyanobacteria bacterium UBA12227]HAX86417.1 adenylate/guanylate cyclase domain-containing response regulator [Cyanobacteria bacterium UBA11370]